MAKKTLVEQPTTAHYRDVNMKKFIGIFIAVTLGYLILYKGFPAFVNWTRAIGINDDIIFYGGYVVKCCVLLIAALLIYGATLILEDDEE